MSEQYLGEIRLFPYNRAPRGWHVCDGALLSVAPNTALFSLLGTTYGGDGRSTFALPDLRGRVMLHQGQGTGLTPRLLGEVNGSERVALGVAQMPPHAHPVAASDGAAAATSPENALPAALPATEAMYVTAATGTTRVVGAVNAVIATGGSVAHENCAPTLTLLPCIAVQGVYPLRS